MIELINQSINQLINFLSHPHMEDPVMAMMGSSHLFELRVHQELAMGWAFLPVLYHLRNAHLAAAEVLADRAPGITYSSDALSDIHTTFGIMFEEVVSDHLLCMQRRGDFQLGVPFDGTDSRHAGTIASTTRGTYGIHLLHK